MDRKPEATNNVYPVLILSLDCGFSPPAKNFWSKIADEMGIDLPVLIAQRDEKSVNQYDIDGFPCLVSSPDKKFYGLHFSHDEAKQILATAVKNYNH